MLELKRITSLYVADQDRISLTAQLGDGGFARIWLTQRIVNRLVPALVNQVKPDHTDAVYADVIAGVAQQRAVDRHEPQAPVRVAEAGHEWLVCKIDMQIAKNGAILIFCSADGDTARLAMNAELLRQWLAILRRVYMAAEWHGAGWPTWIVAPSKTHMAAKVLH
ncbi:hypothetical protein [Parasphingorhabdus sp.]|uniref:hypothetical protein n=1 Tax=Parasphingorhabdus sp. TaxID=2709688 RepID=UPI0030038C86